MKRLRMKKNYELNASFFVVVVVVSCIELVCYEYLGIKITIKNHLKMFAL